MTELSLTEARAQLPSLLDRVRDGEEFTITRHGVPAARLVRPDRVLARRAAAQAAIEAARDIGRGIEEARGRPLGWGTQTPEEADAEVAALRADRDGHNPWRLGE